MVCETAPTRPLFKEVILTDRVITAEDYNYPVFKPTAFEPLMRFEDSPPLGHPGPDFPLWYMADESETCLSDICAENAFTVVEFGSFT